MLQCHHWISNRITDEYHCKQWITIVAVSANGAIAVIALIDANGEHGANGDNSADHQWITIVTIGVLKEI